MHVQNRNAEHKRVVAVLKARLSNRGTCTEVIDAYEELMGSIWSFTARLIGDGGIRAVISRSISVAAREAPLARKVRARETAVDLSELRDHVAQVDCSKIDLMETLIILGAMVFTTLADLTGDTLTVPLINHLKATETRDHS